MVGPVTRGGLTAPDKSPRALLSRDLAERDAQNDIRKFQHVLIRRYDEKDKLRVEAIAQRCGRNFDSRLEEKGSCGV